MHASKRAECESARGERGTEEEYQGRGNGRRRRGEERRRRRGRGRERWKVCETFNRRVAGSPEEYPAEREALEKPVGANLFYFEYKVDDEIFPAAVKMCVVDERADGPWRARARRRRRRGKIF